MIKDGIGGGNTQTGLKFEEDTDLKRELEKEKNIKIIEEKKGKTIKYYKVDLENSTVGFLLAKHKLYYFLEEKEIDWELIISKKLLPDEAYYSVKRKELIIIEKKYQEVAGSVDEKLQTCHFKKRQYERLCKPLNAKVQYVYVLSDWFKKPEYKDVLEYIKEVNCDYYFKGQPLNLDL